MPTRKGEALAGPRQAQIDAFFAMHDAKEEIVRTVQDACGEGAETIDKTDVKDAVSDLFADHDATRDNVIELCEKGADKAIAQAFDLDKGQNARDVLRADGAAMLRHSFAQDDELRSTLRDLIREEIREVCVSLRTMIGEELRAALREAAQPTAAPVGEKRPKKSGTAPAVKTDNTSNEKGGGEIIL